MEAKIFFETPYFKTFFGLPSKRGAVARPKNQVFFWKPQKFYSPMFKPERSSVDFRVVHETDAKIPVASRAAAQRAQSNVNRILRSVTPARCVSTTPAAEGEGSCRRWATKLSFWGCCSASLFYRDDDDDAWEMCDKPCHSIEQLASAAAYLAKPDLKNDMFWLLTKVHFVMIRRGT